MDWIFDDWNKNLIVPFELGWTTVLFPEVDQPHPTILSPYTHHEIQSFAELADLL